MEGAVSTLALGSRVQLGTAASPDPALLHLVTQPPSLPATAWHGGQMSQPPSFLKARWDARLWRGSVGDRRWRPRQPWMWHVLLPCPPFPIFQDSPNFTPHLMTDSAACHVRADHTCQGQCPHNKSLHLREPWLSHMDAFLGEGHCLSSARGHSAQA